MAKDVIIALDFHTKKEVLQFLSKFKDCKPFVKIGMELYYAEGPAIIKQLKKKGHKVFIDLKLHDIPNTVSRAMNVLSLMGVDMLSCHATGCKEMMKAALKGIINPNKQLLVAITQLTSTDQQTLEKELLVKEDMKKVVMHYAYNAKQAGLGGIVCSALEAKAVHKKCGKNFITVTPGIRFADDDKGDQKRVVTPKQARKLGADYIVVGRSITRSKDPVQAYKRCLKEFLED